MAKSSSQLIFDQNKSQILTTIRDKGPISRIELTRETGISAPTVSRIVANLTKDHLVKDTGKGCSSGGRPPVILEFDPSSCYVIGIDWGFTSIEAILADLNGEILSRKKSDHALSKNISQDLNIIISLAESLISEAPLSPSRLKGMGIAAGGYINKRTGMIEYSPVQSWQNIDVITPLSDHFDVPIYLDHHSRVLALSEYLYGDLGDIRDLLFINLSYGLGAGFLINGEIVQGYDGFFGEIGHLYQYRNREEKPRKCLCGKENCLAEFVSGRGLITTARQCLEKGAESALRLLFEGQNGTITERDIIEEAERGDALCREILDEAGELLGIAIANVANILNPQLVVLGGDLSLSSYYFSSIKKAFGNHGLVGAKRSIRMEHSSILRDSLVKGAAALVLQNILNFR